MESNPVFCKKVLRQQQNVTKYGMETVETLHVTSLQFPTPDSPVRAGFE
ncbi:hypothetical protein [Chroococcidiopsis sp. SAG 2025]|nr:hypothetical protein [Chroococcidiopsis sp. SAG 2025]